MDDASADAPRATPTFVLLSGHNDRAVITLCRFLRGAGLPFAIVAAGRDDAIHRTAYADAVIFNRIDKTVTVEWLAALADAVDAAAIHCPTTEFVNDFVLAHRAQLEAAGWIVGLPDRAVYERLTSKLASQAFVAEATGIEAPRAQAMAALRAPCVLKPRVNVSRGRVLYPQLCLDEAALARARADLDDAEWFAQDYIDGQSRYLCGYLCADGRRAWFWQDNLLQQPGGKSIVLARAALEPAFDAGRLFDRLHALGYHGPLMMEVLVDADGRAHYIEINPRFWGPLQLALDACPEILRLFALDHGATLPARPVAPQPHYYAWAHGARTAGCRRYPAASDEGDSADLERLLKRHDIYAAPDTAALHGTH
ncbi:MAG: hypothetical protein ACJ8GJ_00660 [Vitreoscilla sp.]